MPIVLRLCLEALCEGEQHIQMRLTSLVDHNTSPALVIRQSRSKVEGRLHALLDTQPSKVCLCVQGTDGEYLYLSSDDTTPLLKNKRVVETVVASTTPPTAFLNAALVTLEDLKKVNPKPVSRGALVKVPSSAVLEDPPDVEDAPAADLLTNALTGSTPLPSPGGNDYWDKRTPPPTTRHEVVFDFEATPLPTPASAPRQPMTPHNNTDTNNSNTYTYSQFSNSPSATQPPLSQDSQSTRFMSTHGSATDFHRTAKNASDIIVTYIDGLTNHSSVLVSRQAITSNSKLGHNGNPDKAALHGILSIACENLEEQMGKKMSPGHMKLLCKFTETGALNTISEDGELLVALMDKDAQFFLIDTHQKSKSKKHSHGRSLSRATDEDSLHRMMSPRATAPMPESSMKHSGRRRSSNGSGSNSGSSSSQSYSGSSSSSSNSESGSESERGRHTVSKKTRKAERGSATQSSSAYGTQNSVKFVELGVPPTSTAPPLPRLVTSTTLTLTEVASSNPPQLTPKDRNGVLRTIHRPEAFSSLLTPPGRPSAEEAKWEEDVAEEDAARLALAVAHKRYQAACGSYEAATRGNGGNTGASAQMAVEKRLEELAHEKRVLREELEECVSGERDCQRLEMMIDYFNKEVTAGSEREKQLVIAIRAGGSA